LIKRKDQGSIWTPLEKKEVD